MNIFIDECLAGTIAAAINPILSKEAFRAISPLHNPDAHLNIDRGSSDLNWMRTLGESGEPWLVVTNDSKIKARKLEAEALFDAKLAILFVSQSWNKLPVHRKVGILCYRLDEIRNAVGGCVKPCAFQLDESLRGTLKGVKLSRPQ